VNPDIAIYVTLRFHFVENEELSDVKKKRKMWRRCRLSSFSPASIKR